MLKLYTLCISLLAVLGVQAQITIGQAEMPHANDELVRVKAVTNPLINFTATGPAHTWDYANLAANQGDTTNYQTVASTNFFYAIIYADLPFNPNRANHAKQGTDIAFSNLLPITNPYTFRYRSNSVYKAVGYGVELAGLPVPIIFDEHDVIYELPIAYGDASASHSAYHVDIPNVGYYGFQQDRTNTVDGWGGITTPGGVFDVLRVRTTLTMRDSIAGFAFNRPVAHEYKWLAQGLRVPVLQINTTTLFGQEIVNAIYYYDVPRSIEVVEPLATTICPGATVDLHYTVTGAFNAGGFFVQPNHFTAQLSDASGSFANPVDIGDVTATTSGTITVTIPANTPLGTGYRIRVISNSPDYVGTPNTFDITIGGTTVASIIADGPSLICTDDTLMLTAVGGPGYQWQMDGTDINGANDATYSATAAGAYTVMVDNACGTAISNSIVVELNAPPVQVVDGMDYAICVGASVDLMVHDASGQSPLTYQWFLNDAPIAGATDTVHTSTLAGIYTVQVTNGITGCSSLSTEMLVDVQSVTTPIATADGATTFCNGGAVVLSTTGAPTDTYQWYMDGIVIVGAATSELSTIASGDYSVMVMNAIGCASDTSEVISVVVNALPTAPTIAANGPTMFCTGGSVELSIPLTGGASYQWYLDGGSIPAATDTFLVATTSGNYTAMITSAEGCASEASASSSIMVMEAPIAPAITPTEPTTFCEGGGVTLIADAIVDVSYQWLQDGTAILGANSNQLSVFTSGSYTLIVTNTGGCSSTTDPAVDVVVNPLPATPVITSSSDSLLTSGTGTFQWYLDGAAIFGANDPWWIPTEDGNYTVQFTDANGCSSLSEAWFFLTTGVRAIGSNSFAVMPNPSDGSFAIQTSKVQGQAYEILDATGKRVSSGRLNGMRTNVDMRDAQNGMYFVRILTSTSTPVMRIVISH